MCRCCDIPAPASQQGSELLPRALMASLGCPGGCRCECQLNTNLVVLTGGAAGHGALSVSARDAALVGGAAEFGAAYTEHLCSCISKMPGEAEEGETGLKRAQGKKWGVRWRCSLLPGSAAASALP